MVKIRRVSATLLDKQRTASTADRPLSPRALARQQQERQIERMVRKLASPEDVFEIDLSDGEKPATIRQRILKVAGDANVEIAVRRRENGFLVGLMTPDRQERRGRRSKAAASS